MPSSAVFSSFENFPISVGRTLLPCNSAIVIAVIVDFACCEFSEGIHSAVVVSLALAFTALLMVLSSCVGIHADVTVLPLVLSSRTVS